MRGRSHRQKNWREAENLVCRCLGIKLFVIESDSFLTRWFPDVNNAPSSLHKVGSSLKWKARCSEFKATCWARMPSCINRIWNFLYNYCFFIWGKKAFSTQYPWLSVQHAALSGSGLEGVERINAVRDAQAYGADGGYGGERAWGRMSVKDRIGRGSVRLFSITFAVLWTK